MAFDEDEQYHTQEYWKTQRSGNIVIRFNQQLIDFLYFTNVNCLGGNINSICTENTKQYLLPQWFTT